MRPERLNERTFIRGKVREKHARSWRVTTLALFDELRNNSHNSLLLPSTRFPLALLPRRKTLYRFNILLHSTSVAAMNYWSRIKCFICHLDNKQGGWPDRSGQAGNAIQDRTTLA